MLGIFYKTKKKPSANLINHLKKIGTKKTVKSLIQSENIEDIGPSSGFNIITDEDFDFLDIDDRIALDYINRVGFNNKNLIDKVWSKELKKIATYEIFLGLKEGISNYSLGRNLEKELKSNFPKDFLEATARTETSYEFSHSKIDLLLSETSLLPMLKDM